MVSKSVVKYVNQAELHFVSSENIIKTRIKANHTEKLFDGVELISGFTFIATGN